MAALLGGILVGLAGLWESHEPFDLRKFGASAIRALVAGGVFAALYVLEGPLTGLDLLWAFLAGAGADTAINRFAGALGNGTFPLPKGK